MSDKQTVTIDGKNYGIDSLSKEARDLLMQVRAAEVEINALKMRLIFTETARKVFAESLKKILPI